MSHEPRLPCPSCGYDLVGIFREDDTATCPECGNHTNLRAVQRELEKRAAWWHAPLALLIAFATLVFITSATGMSLTDIGFANLLFAGLLGTIAFLASYWWIDLTRLERVVFAAGALVLALLDSFWMQPVLLTLWFAGFWVYSFLREWRLISDRW